MTQDDQTFDLIGHQLLNIAAFGLLVLVSDKYEKFVAVGLVGGQDLIQYFGIIMMVQIGNDNADKFSLSVGQNACHFVFFIAKFF